MNRLPGYYWIKTGGQWIIAFYHEVNDHDVFLAFWPRGKATAPKGPYWEEHYGPVAAGDLEKIGPMLQPPGGSIAVARTEANKSEQERSPTSITLVAGGADAAISSMLPDGIIFHQVRMATIKGHADPRPVLSVEICPYAVFVEMAASCGWKVGMGVESLAKCSEIAQGAA